MIKYPMTFEATAKGTSGIDTPFEAAAESFSPIPCSIPKQFLGPGIGYSPEDLFTISAIACFIATFKVFAKKAGLPFASIDAQATLTIDRDASGVPCLQKLDMTITLSGIEDEEMAKQCLAETEKYCLISNAIKPEKSFTYNFA